jgi:hypothetical protein
MGDDQLMSLAQTHELLIRLDERTKSIVDKVNALDSQVAGLCSLYPTHATHAEKIEQVEHDIQIIFDRDKWRNRSIVGTFIALIISTFWKHLGAWLSAIF